MKLELDNDLTVVELDNIETTGIKTTVVYLTVDDIYVHPIWSNKQLCHNWHNYVSEEIRSEWFNFTILQRIMLGKNFQDLADHEEWE